MDTIQLIEMTSRECKNYLIEGGDLCFLPVGSVERLGPHLPLAARCHIAFAFSEMLARENGGLCMPVLPYTTTYDSKGVKGSVYIHPNTVKRYLYNVCKELVANGFRRIVLVGHSDELYYLAHEFFQQENIAIVLIAPEQIFSKMMLDKDQMMTNLVAASLKLCKREDILVKLLEKNKQYLGRYEKMLKNQEPYSVLKRIGKIGYHGNIEEFDILPVENIDVEKAIECMRAWVHDKSDAFSSLKEYNNYLSRIRFDRGVK